MIKPVPPKRQVVVSGMRMENDFFRVVFDSNGNIAEIYDKRCDRDVLQKGKKGNVLQVFEDFPKDYDAWEISCYYREKSWEIGDPCFSSSVEDGARAGVEVVKISCILNLCNGFIFMTIFPRLTLILGLTGVKNIFC